MEWKKKQTHGIKLKLQTIKIFWVPLEIKTMIMLLYIYILKQLLIYVANILTKNIKKGLG